MEGRCLVAEVEELEILDTSEIHALRLNTKENDYDEKIGEQFHLLNRRKNSELSGRDRGVRESAPTRDQLVRS